MISLKKHIFELFNIQDENKKKIHSFSKERYIHITKWIDEKEYRYNFVKRNWKHPKFYPYISQFNAEKKCDHEKTILVRLSNSRPGVISISHPKNIQNHRSTYISYIDKKGLLTYKNKKLNLDEFMNELDSECVICNNTLKRSDTLTHQCGNTFHKHCILKWKKIKSSCPFCRYSLDTLCENIIENNLQDICNYTPFDLYCVKS